MGSNQFVVKKNAIPYHFQDLRRLSVERGQELLVLLDRELDLGALCIILKVWFAFVSTNPTS